MSKKIELQLTIDVHPTQDHPPFEATLFVNGSDSEGVVWEKTLKAGGKTEVDAVDTVCRNNLLPKTISAIALVVSQPTPSYTQEKVVKEEPVPEKSEYELDIERDAFYEEIREKVLTMKFAEIRAFVKDQGLSVKFANNVPREKIGAVIIQALQEKE